MRICIGKMSLVAGLEEEGVLREVQQRIVRSFLDVLILAQLKKEPKSSRETFAIIQKKYSCFESSELGYSTLYSMEIDGFIQHNLDEGMGFFTLTDKGDKTIQAFLNASGKIRAFLVYLLDDLSE